MPPLLEHLESLLSGTGRELDLRPSSWSTSSAAAPSGIAGRHHAAGGAHRRPPAQPRGRDPPVLLRPGAAHAAAVALATREPLQFGAEIFGHAGLEADLEGRTWRWTPARRRCAKLCARPGRRPHRARCAGRGAVDAAQADRGGARRWRKGQRRRCGGCRRCPARPAPALHGCCGLYGGGTCWTRLAVRCHSAAVVHRRWTIWPGWPQHVQRAHPLRIGFDLADMSGYAYYSGSALCALCAGRSECAGAGGRYDEVGAVFGRNRPAVGFSLDLKELAEVATPARSRAAVRPPGANPRTCAPPCGAARAGRHRGLRTARAHEHEAQEFDCDRELVASTGNGCCARFDACQQRN
jgi:ATP phosphoribosyltransferase regulatory subunit